MNQSTTTQSKTRFRPVKITADGLPGGPLPTQSIAQNPAARPAIIRTVVSTGTAGEPAKVVLARQDELSQPAPRMLSEERLQRYVQNLQASPAADSEASDNNQASDSVVTWTTPQINQAINLSEATSIEPKIIYHTHAAHPDPEPHLLGWPKEAEVEPDVDVQLEQATKIDAQLKQLELRIDKLRSEATQKADSERSIREQEILANPEMGDLIASISTAIVSAIQEKSEAEILPQAKRVFEERLQQHAVTLGEHADSVVATDTTDQLGSEAMFSSIAAQRHQEQATANISKEPSQTALLENLRERIADYQRTMTSQTATEAADMVTFGESTPSEITMPAMVQGPTEQAVAKVEPLPVTSASAKKASPLPVVQFTASPRYRSTT